MCNRWPRAGLLGLGFCAAKRSGEEDRQNGSGKHQSDMEAVFNAQQRPQFRPIVDMQAVVRPPVAQNPGDCEVSDPGQTRGSIANRFYDGITEQQEGDGGAQTERIQYAEPQKERRQIRRGRGHRRIYGQAAEILTVLSQNIADDTRREAFLGAERVRQVLRAAAGAGEGS